MRGQTTGGRLWKRRWALAVAAIAMSTVACGSGESEEAFEDREQGPIPAVEIVQARVGALPLQERLSGVVRAENQVAIYPEISAPVLEVMVRSGQLVEFGQPLVRLEDDALQDQLRQAEAAVALAEASAAEAVARVAEIEAQVTRTRALAEQDLVSEVDLETQEARLQATQASAAAARARVQQAEATVQERRSQLADTLVRAPISGSVGQRNVEVGMLVDPGTLLFQIGNLNSLIVEVPLTEGMLAYIDEGLPVEISSSSLGEGSVRAVLSRISPFLESTSFSTIGEVDVANTDGPLRPGMFVTVDVLYGESERATLVPTSALWEDPRTGLIGVFVAAGYSESGRPVSGLAPTSDVTSADLGSVATAELSEEAFPIEFRPVEVLAEGRQSVGITGVEPGEWVVTLGQHLFSSEEETLEAHVRESSWEKVVALQGLQREDLLRGFLEKQQRLARERGATPPTNEEFLGKSVQTPVPRGPVPASTL